MRGIIISRGLQTDADETQWPDLISFTSWTKSFSGKAGKFDLTTKWTGPETFCPQAVIKDSQASIFMFGRIYNKTPDLRIDKSWPQAWVTTKNAPPRDHGSTG